MLLLIGLIFIIFGYLILFTVPSEATFERIFAQALAGMGVSVVGGILLMIYIYGRSK